jgi:hypothetical protein
VGKKKSALAAYFKYQGLEDYTDCFLAQRFMVGVRKEDGLGPGVRSSVVGGVLRGVWAPRPINLLSELSILFFFFLLAKKEEAQGGLALEMQPSGK